MHTICVTTAPRLPPVDSHALIIGGVVHGTMTTAFPAKPAAVAM